VVLAKIGVFEVFGVLGRGGQEPGFRRISSIPMAKRAKNTRLRRFYRNLIADFLGRFWLFATAFSYIKVMKTTHT